MEVNIANLKIEISKLNNLIKDYENNYLNLYNEFSSVSFFWQDNNEKKFVDEISREKLKIETSLKEINALKEIYDYIIEKYQELGEKIRFDLNERDNIIAKFNQYINKLNDIIKSYSSLNASFFPQSHKLTKEQEKLINMKKKAQSLKELYINTLNNIENIEKEVNLKLSKIKIEILKVE